MFELVHKEPYIFNVTEWYKAISESQTTEYILTLQSLNPSFDYFRISQENSRFLNKSLDYGLLVLSAPVVC